MINYLAGLTAGKIVLWCYLIWYGVTVYFHFDPSLRIWLNALGISLIIGVGLMLAVARPPGSKVDPWQTFRLFLMPFCVSSFSALIKGKGYILIAPPAMRELAVSAGACTLFVALVLGIKHFHR